MGNAFAGRNDTAIRGDHRIGMNEDAAHILLGHGVEDTAEAALFLQLERELCRFVDGDGPVLVAQDVGETFSLKRRIPFAARDDDVFGVTAPSVVLEIAHDRRFDAGALGGIAHTRQLVGPLAFEAPSGEENRKRRARSGVGILVDRHVDAARARRVHHLERLHARAPHRRPDNLVMGDL